MFKSTSLFQVWKHCHKTSWFHLPEIPGQSLPLHIQVWKHCHKTIKGAWLVWILFYFWGRKNMLELIAEKCNSLDILRYSSKEMYKLRVRMLICMQTLVSAKVTFHWTLDICTKWTKQSVSIHLERKAMLVLGITSSVPEIVNLQLELTFAIVNLRGILVW